MTPTSSLSVILFFLAVIGLAAGNASLGNAVEEADGIIPKLGKSTRRARKLKKSKSNNPSTCLLTQDEFDEFRELYLNDPGDLQISGVSLGPCYDGLKLAFDECSFKTWLCANAGHSSCTTTFGVITICNPDISSQTGDCKKGLEMMRDGCRCGLNW